MAKKMILKIELRVDEVLPVTLGDLADYIKYRLNLRDCMQITNIDLIGDDKNEK